MNLQRGKWLAIASAVAAGLLSSAKPAEVSSFYVVSEGFSDAMPGWHRSVLEVQPEGADLLVRYIRVSPANSTCGDATAVVATATRLEDTSLDTFTHGLNLCTLDPSTLDRTIQAYPARKGMIVFAGDVDSIVARCGADTKVIQLPGDWTADRARLMKEHRQIAALWKLEETIGKRAFGPFPYLDVVPGEMAARLRPAGEAVLSDLKSGKFDAGLRSGSFKSDVAALHPMSGGPEYSVTLANADRLQFEDYINPAYPPLAIQARIHGQVELELTSDPATGEMKEVTAISGHPLLLPVSTKAARQWRVRPGPDRALHAIRIKLEFAVHCP